MAQHVYRYRNDLALKHDNRTSMNIFSTGRYQLALLAPLAVAAACGPATNSHYQGEPLATIHGQLTVPEGTAISGSVRLALVWYLVGGPIFDPNTGAPKSIVTQDLEYQGIFPLNYSFELHEPPPAEALQRFGGDVKIAQGLIVAYQDLNGNGRLDIIPSGGNPVDRVLGSSGGDRSVLFGGPLGSIGFVVLYVDGTISETGGIALQSGFNIIHNYLTSSGASATELVPFSTSIPLRLTGRWTNDLFVCDDYFYRLGPPWRCGVTPPRDLLIVLGRITAKTRGSSAALAVTDALNGAIKSDALVTVNGRLIPFDPSAPNPYPYRPGEPRLGAYVLDDVVPFVSVGTANDVKVQASGFKDFQEFAVVPTLQVTSPVPNATLPSGTPFPAVWLSAAGVSSYSVELRQCQSGNWDQPGLGFFLEMGSTITTYVDPQTCTGTAELTITATGARAWPIDSDVSPSSSQTIPIRLGP